MHPDASVEWWAWTEWWSTRYNDSAVVVTNFPISAGDTVSVLICAPRPNYGSVWMQNLTTGQATSVGIDARPGITSAGSSAEWVVEGISAELPVFLPAITFSGCTASTQHDSFNLQPHGLPTDINGTNGPLTKTSIASPTTVVIEWEGWT